MYEEIRVVSRERTADGLGGHTEGAAETVWQGYVDLQDASAQLRTRTDIGLEKQADAVMWFGWPGVIDDFTAGMEVQLLTRNRTARIVEVSRMDFTASIAWT